MTGHLMLLPASLLHHDGLDPQVENQNNSPSLLLLLGMFVIKGEVSNYHTCYSSLKVVVERLQTGSPHLLNLMHGDSKGERL